MSQDDKTATVLAAAGRLRSAHQTYLTTTRQRDLTAAIDEREAALRQVIEALNQLETR